MHNLERLGCLEMALEMRMPGLVPRLQLPTTWMTPNKSFNLTIWLLVLLENKTQFLRLVSNFCSSLIFERRVILHVLENH